MATLYFTGFESGDTRELNGASGAYSIQNSVVRSGNFALKANAGIGQNTNIQIAALNAAGQFVALNAATVCTRFYLFFEALPTNGAEPIYVVRSSTGIKAEVRIDSMGYLTMYNAAGVAVGFGWSALQTGVWYCIGIVTESGSSAWEIHQNGSLDGSGTADFGTGAATLLQLGKYLERGGSGYVAYFDDVMVDNAALPGEGRCIALPPTYDGEYLGWSGEYTSVADLPSDGDGSYIRSTVAGDARTFELWIPRPELIAAVNAVKAFAVVRDENAVSSFRLRLRSAGIDHDTNINDPGASYTGRQRIFDLEPTYGAPWTADSVNAAQPGVVNAANSALRCSSLALMIDYVEATGGGATIVPAAMNSYRRRRKS